jgi:hypothetical protein
MGMAGSVVDLGFADACVPHGTHVCQIYADAGERDDALLRFLSRGLRSGETTACFSDNIDEQAIEAWLAKDGVSLAKEREAGRFALCSARATYFDEGRFDPQRMLAHLTAFHEGSLKAGRPGARVIGEMCAEIGQVPGGARLLEYEARVNSLLREHPVTAVCQYDARAFDGALLMDVLAVHPMMVVRGAVIHNPFFVPPEELIGA